MSAIFKNEYRCLTVIKMITLLKVEILSSLHYVSVVHATKHFHTDSSKVLSRLHPPLPRPLSRQLCKYRHFVCSGKRRLSSHTQDVYIRTCSYSMMMGTCTHTHHTLIHTAPVHTHPHNHTRKTLLHTHLSTPTAHLNAHNTQPHPSPHPHPQHTNAHNTYPYPQHINAHNTYPYAPTHPHPQDITAHNTYPHPPTHPHSQHINAHNTYPYPQHINAHNTHPHQSTHTLHSPHTHTCTTFHTSTFLGMMYPPTSTSTGNERGVPPAVGNNLNETNDEETIDQTLPNTFDSDVPVRCIGLSVSTSMK